jgi:hypothetical protein
MPHLQDTRAGVATFAEEHAGEEVEDASAHPAAIIDHAGMAVMRGLGGC